MTTKEEIFTKMEPICREMVDNINKLGLTVDELEALFYIVIGSTVRTLGSNGFSRDAIYFSNRLISMLSMNIKHIIEQSLESSQEKNLH